jgi:hypothetical protein
MQVKIRGYQKRRIVAAVADRGNQAKANNFRHFSALKAL